MGKETVEQEQKQEKNSEVLEWSKKDSSLKCERGKWGWWVSGNERQIQDILSQLVHRLNIKF